MNAELDLLKAGPLRSILLWNGLPRTLQAVVLAAIIFEPEAFLRLLPVVLVATVLLGRIWCAVCPLKLIGALPEWLSHPDHDVPRWAASGILGVLLYGILLIAPPAPRFLVGLAVFTVFISVVFRGRAFCRTLCPASEMLATYGRGGMIAIRPAPAEVRATCPVGLDPAKLNQSRDCHYCLSCVHQGGMRVLLRWPFAPQDVRRALSSWPAALFVVLTSAALIWRRTGDDRLAIALWPALAITAWGLGGAATPWQALRRLALPGSVMLIGAHLAGFLPLEAAIALVAVSAFLSSLEARKAGWSGGPALLAPLLILALVFAYSLLRI